MNEYPSAALSKDVIVSEVIAILSHMTSDWDLDLSGGISRQTKFVADLCCESLDVVNFVVAVQERFGRRDLPFEQLLMEDGRYVGDLSVESVADFLYAHLNQPMSTAT